MSRLASGLYQTIRSDLDDFPVHNRHDVTHMPDTLIISILIMLYIIDLILDSIQHQLIV